MKKHYVTLHLLVPFFIAAMVSLTLKASEGVYEAAYYEEQGIPHPSSPSFDPADSQRSLAEIPESGLLLIPNSTANTVMAFDPFSGDLVDEFYFPPEPDNLSTPILVMWNHDETNFLISDQLRKLVQQFDTDGNFEQTFAPIGGEDQDILHNIRGMHMRPDGNLLVSVAGGSNANSVAMFDTEGEYLGNFIDNNAGGLNSPWNIVFRPDHDDYLITASGSGSIHRFDPDGNPIGIFVSGLNFPQQLAVTDEGNVLVSTFSAPAGVYEFDSDGNQLGYYGVLSNLRGVYELGNGNILVTNGNGVHEINRDNQLVETKVAGGARHINLIMPPAPDNGLFVVTFDVVHEDGTGIVDAIITFDGETMDEGEYVFADISPGTYGFSVEKSCHPTVEGQLTVTNSNHTEEVVLVTVPGDANGDGLVNVLDVIEMVNYFVGFENELDCFDNADVNNDGVVDILDIIATISIFGN